MTVRELAVVQLAATNYVDTGVWLRQLARFVRSRNRRQTVILFAARDAENAKKIAKLVQRRSGDSIVVGVDGNLSDSVPRELGVSLRADEFLVMRPALPNVDKLTVPASRIREVSLPDRLDALNEKLFSEGLADQVARFAARQERIERRQRRIQPEVSAHSAPTADKPAPSSQPLEAPPAPRPVPRPPNRSLHVRPRVPDRRTSSHGREAGEAELRRPRTSSTTSYKTLLRADGAIVRVVRLELQKWLASKSVEAALLGPEKGSIDVEGRERTWDFTVGQVGTSRALRFTMVESSEGVTYTTEVVAFEAVGAGQSWVHIYVYNDGGKFTGTPRLASQLVANLEVRDARRRIRSEPEWVGADQLRHLVLDPTRQLPVLVFATDHQMPKEALGGLEQLAHDCTKQLAGQAHIVLTDPAATAEFNRSMADGFDSRPWSIRIYRPGVDLENPLDARQHRFVSTRALADSTVRRIERRLVGITRGATELRVPVAELRRAENLLERAEHQRIQQAELDALQAVIEASEASASEEARGTAISQERPVEPLLERLRLAILQLYDVEALSEDLLEEIQDDLTSPDYSSRVDELEQQLADQEAAFAVEVAILTDDLAQADVQITEMQNELDRARRECRFYQTRLAQHDARAAYQEYVDDQLTLHNMDELLEAASQLPHVELTWNEEIIRDIDEWDTHETAPALSWQALTALDAYARAKADGYNKGFLDFVREGRTSLGPGRVALGESQMTMGRWGHERIFNVPTSVAPTGKMTMEAHIRISNVGGDKSPRLHFYDDTSGPTGKVIVGYLGPHLTNTQTKNR